MKVFQRRLRSLTTWPDASGWRICALIALVGLVVMAGLAWAGGLWVWRPDIAGWPLRLLIVMIVPALGEEVVFRGLLTPDRGETRRPALWIASGVAVFVLWHVVEALTFLPGARGLFLTPGFLGCAAALGTTCALLRYYTGSLWPAVIFHGLVVFLWQTLLGGPGFRQFLAI